MSRLKLLISFITLFTLSACSPSNADIGENHVFTEKFELNSKNHSALGISFKESYKNPQCNGHNKSDRIFCTVIINNEEKRVVVSSRGSMWVKYPQKDFSTLLGLLKKTHKVNYTLDGKTCFDNCRIVIRKDDELTHLSYNDNRTAERTRIRDIETIRIQEKRKMAINNSKNNTL